MSYVLGVEIGSDWIAAAVAVDLETAQVLPLDREQAAVPLLVYWEWDNFVIGDRAASGAQSTPEWAAGDFWSRLADPLPVVVGNQVFPAEELVAGVLKSILWTASQRHGGGPELVVINHPRAWDDARRAALRYAATLAGVDEKRVHLLALDDTGAPDAEAAIKAALVAANWGAPRPAGGGGPGMLSPMPPLPPLPPMTLLVVEVGSTAHGTGRPGHEDHDEIAVYAEHPSEVLGLADGEPRSRMLRTAEEGAVSTPEDSDRVLHPLRRFVRLCARGNPSLVMAFWAPVIQTTPLGDELRDLGPAFVGRHLVDRYRGYMRDQAQKVLGVRAVPGQSHYDPAVGYQTKAAMHASRLGFQGFELLTTGTLELPIQGEPREWLLAVRNGGVPFEEWWDRTLQLDQRLGALADDDSIPPGPDLSRVEPWLADTYRKLWTGLTKWTPPPPPPPVLEAPSLPPVPPAPQPPPAPAPPEPSFPEPAVVGQPVPPLPPVETWFVEDCYEPIADVEDSALATDLTALERWVPRLRVNLAAPWSVATRLRVEGSARWHGRALIDEPPLQLTALRLPEDSLNPAEGVPLLSRLRMLYERLLPHGIRYPIAADWYQADGRAAVLDRFSRLPAGRLNGFLLSSEVTDSLGVVVAGSAPSGRDPALLNVAVPLASAVACRDDDFLWATPPNWYRVEELVMTTPNLQATAKLEPLSPGTDADAWTQIVFSRAPFLRDMKVLADRSVPIAGVTDVRMQRFDWQPSGGMGRQLTTVATGLVDGGVGFSFVFEVPLDTTFDSVFLADPDEVLASISVIAAPER